MCPSKNLSELATPYDRQVVRLWDTLDRAAQRVGRERRGAERFQYRSGAVILYIADDDGRIEERTPVLAPTRDISESGLCFLHGGPIEPGTKCQVVLKTLDDGSWVTHECRVARHRHIDGLMHEVGLQFERPIDPARYCDCTSTAGNQADNS